MLPVFNEYIQFLKDKTNSDSQLNILSEGYYWLDRQIIKAYNKKGELQKVLRVKVDNNLDISISGYKQKFKGEIESWDESCIRNKSRLVKLENDSLKTITDTIEEYKDYTPAILYSGGKDSLVTRHLVIQINKCQSIYSNTSLECGDTGRHISN